ncbi:hypothetical protein BTVI_27363 [Pitangus sulphuratus]|nr:hypothetical protein BTVI_27363 [Pitangus sulphuratus]
MRSCWRLPPGLTEPMPAPRWIFCWPRMRSDSSSTFGIMHFRTGTKRCGTTGAEVRICEESNSAHTKVSEVGVGESVPVTTAELPLQPVAQTMVGHSRAKIHLQPLEDPTLEQIDVPKEAVIPWEACAGEGYRQDR